MEVKIQIKKGKITFGREKVTSLFQSLDDGDYLLEIAAINPLKTEADFQRAYFASVDLCVMESGNSRYIIHDAFKDFKNVESTKNFNLSEWKKFLEEFKIWAYNTMDVVT